jgi:hypothetical protein
MQYFVIQLTLVISNSMGPWKKFESTVVRLERSYENTRSVLCLTMKRRQLERNFEELKPASHVPILGTILNIFDVFVAVFFSLLNSLNLVKRLITSRYLFLCEWICLSVLFMFFACFVAPLESNYGWLEFFPWSHRIRDNESQLYLLVLILPNFLHPFYPEK